MSNATSTKLTQFLRPLDEEYLLITPPGTGVDGEGWEPDVALGRLPGSGTANALIRPCFKTWEIRARFRFDTLLAPQMTLQTLVRLLQIAGAGYGLGSHNPAHKGLNGIFDVVEVKRFKIDNKLQEQLDAIAAEDAQDEFEEGDAQVQREAQLAEIPEQVDVGMLKGRDGNGSNGHGESHKA